MHENITDRIFRRYAYPTPRAQAVAMVSSDHTGRMSPLLGRRLRAGVTVVYKRQSVVATVYVFQPSSPC